MKVRITDANTNIIVAEFEITLLTTYGTSSKEYFEEAWLSAIDDKKVDATKKNQYKFMLIQEDENQI